MQTPFKRISYAGARLAACLLLAAFAAVAARAALPRPVVWSDAQKASASLQIEHLAPAPYQPQFAASATVQSPSGLLRGLSAQQAAQAQLAVAQSRLRLATLQARRDQGLFEAGQNIALAQVQQAQAAAAQAQAEVASAQATLGLARARLTADLGPALAMRLLGDARLRQSILSGHALVVDLNLLPGQSLPAAAQVWLHLPSGQNPVQARVVGPAAAASSELQGLRETLIAPAASGLMPGLALQAEVRSAQAQSGVRLPASAVVWTGGQAVIFVASKSADHAWRFSSRAVSTAWALQGGYVQPGWGALDVVTRGAGLVLTPPPRPQALPASGAEDD